MWKCINHGSSAFFVNDLLSQILAEKQCLFNPQLSVVLQAKVVQIDRIASYRTTKIFTRKSDPGCR